MRDSMNETRNKTLRAYYSYCLMDMKLKYNIKDGIGKVLDQHFICRLANFQQLDQNLYQS